MSVLIKNMEIPEHCGYCRFRYDGICHALQKTQYSVEECPLVSVNDINASPTIEPQQWIPVTVRCPEKSGDYLVTDDCKNIYVNEWHCLLHKWQYDDSRIIAWMPLPEPWKGEEDVRKSD